MTTTPPAPAEIEERLRAALSARAEQVRAEDLAPLTPVVPLRPRWRSPWVLLATAAVVLLILGIVFQGLGSDPRSDRLAPDPDGPEIEPDVGRDWKADAYSTPARLDLDGDGVKEKVEFLSERTKTGSGRVRIETTLSSTGEESYGVVELSTNVVVNALPPLDADSDGDQELALYDGDVMGAAGGYLHPIVLDLRDGLLVEASVSQPELLQMGNVREGNSGTPYYDVVRSHSYWIEDGTLYSGRSVSTFASGVGMTATRPQNMVLDSWRWRLDDGMLRPEADGCLLEGLSEERRPCPDGARDSLPVVSPVATGTIGVGEQFEWTEGYRFTARLEAVADPALIVEGADGRTINHGLEVADPLVLTTQPTGIFYDGASLVVLSASDPSYLQVLVQDGGRLRALEPVGDIPLAGDGVRTWLTADGALVSVVPGDDDTWRAWWWQRSSGTEMAALPAGEVCFDDVEDPTTGHAC